MTLRLGALLAATAAGCAVVSVAESAPDAGTDEPAGAGGVAGSAGQGGTLAGGTAGAGGSGLVEQPDATADAPPCGEYGELCCKGQWHEDTKTCLCGEAPGCKLWQDCCQKVPSEWVCVADGDACF